MGAQHDPGLCEDCWVVIDVGHCVHSLAAVNRVDGAFGLYAAHLSSRVAENVSSFVESVGKCLGPVVAWGWPNSRNVIVGKTQVSSIPPFSTATKPRGSSVVPTMDDPSVTSCSASSMPTGGEAYNVHYYQHLGPASNSGEKARRG